MYFSIVDKIAAGLDIDSVFICIDFNFVFCFWVVFAFLFFFLTMLPGLPLKTNTPGSSLGETLG